MNEQIPNGELTPQASQVEDTGISEQSAQSRRSEKSEQTLPFEQTDSALENGNDSDRELEQLRDQVKRLTEELNEKSARSERIAAELGEFYQLFPDTDIKALPDEVWEGVRSGTSLAASLALYNHRVSAREARAKEINDRNSALSTGRVGTAGASEYFTPDEVRSMSRSEVRANYSKIIESMKKWSR